MASDSSENWQVFYFIAWSLTKHISVKTVSRALQMPLSSTFHLSSSKIHGAQIGNSKALKQQRPLSKQTQEHESIASGWLWRQVCAMAVKEREMSEPLTQLQMEPGHILSSCQLRSAPRWIVMHSRWWGHMHLSLWWARMMWQTNFHTHLQRTFWQARWKDALQPAPITDSFLHCHMLHRFSDLSPVFC